MEYFERKNNSKYMSYKEFHKGVPDNLHYEYTYLKGLEPVEKTESILRILIGVATILVGAIAVMLPICFG